MNIVIKPGEMLKEVSGVLSKPMVVEFKTNWDYGHIFVVDGLTHCTGYRIGDKKAFPAKASIHIANGGVSDMEIEIITVW
jgi:hypothetical protein